MFMSDLAFITAPAAVAVHTPAAQDTFWVAAVETVSAARVDVSAPAAIKNAAASAQAEILLGMSKYPWLNTCSSYQGLN
jgi:hypothetical protein